MRLFAAIKLSDALKTALLHAQDAMAAQGVCGNFTPEENLHLTLAFIGERPEAQPVLDALASVPFTPFTITLEGLGCFDDLWWAGIRDAAPLTALAQRVRSALTERGIPCDGTSFLPHITLLRKATQDVTGIAVASASMTVHRFSLLRSDFSQNGMLYTELGSVDAASD